MKLKHFLFALFNLITLPIVTPFYCIYLQFIELKKVNCEDINKISIFNQFFWK